MGYPKFIDEVAFASNPLDTTQTYTVLTSRTARRSFGRGRRSENDTPDTGSCQVTFENSDRYLDSEYAASPYYPNVIPMRRIRCWVDDVLPADGGSLTVSGNEITDALRALGIQGDGRLADSSFGIWPAATNECPNGGGETNTAGWAGWNGGAAPLRVSASERTPKFGQICLRASCDGTSANQGLFFDTGNTLAPSTTRTYSVWVYNDGSAPLRLQLREVDAGGALVGATVGAAATLVGWQRYTITRTFGASGVRAQLVVEQSGTAVQNFWVDGEQIEAGSFATPYIHTDGATATRSAAGVQAPASLLNTTQGWWAARVRVGFPSTTALPGSGNPILARWREGAGNVENYTLVFDTATSRWTMRRRTGSANIDLAAPAVAFAVGDVLTIIGKWGSGQIGISVNGAAFSAAAASAAALTQATFGIGYDDQVGNQQINGDVLWFACGTGTLADADAAAIHAMGNTAADASDMLWPAGADVSMVWQADTVTYRVPSDAFLYTNFVDPEQGWQLDRLGPGQMDAIVPGNDGFDLLSTYKLDALTAYPQQYAGQRVAAILDTIGWPAAERDVDLGTNGQSEVQAAVAGSLTGVSALSAIQAAAGNDNGIFFIDGRGYAVFKGRHRTDSRHLVSRATFVDAANYTAGRFLYAELVPSQSKIRNDFRVTRQGGSEVQWENSTSIAKNGRRTEAVSTLHTTDGEALNYAQYRVAAEKDSHRRYDSMTLRPGDDTATWLLLLGLEIGDRVTVMQTPPGGGPADSREMYVEAIGASIGPGVESEWTLRLSPVDTTNGWVIGDAVYGLLGQTTYLTY